MPTPIASSFPTRRPFSPSMQRQRSYPPPSPTPPQHSYPPAPMMISEPYAPSPQRVANTDFTPRYASQLATLRMRSMGSYDGYRSSTAGSMLASFGVFDYSSWSEGGRWTPESSASPMLPPASVHTPAPATGPVYTAPEPTTH
ncbi:uncharacterized protein STEHIDRAFT_156041 [Stereum hirsutum FP-91666 SS1]|uniref:uncharacterized protein n=1 Tax=Stereum hirsutum (strain FP-91666) TaxID=721885 RepID=UPI000440F50A|nr:uncharacterized protein STEHIDRAFT_156041 [Stereum hirsutum FP-91666 SS1]EIM87046.1 hypothetical protein STEHIDRAFT_156041 [Stereum hirsutum FP-91666 SS1]